VCPGWAPAPGGVERHTRDLARALDEIGARVSVLALDVNADGPEWSARDVTLDGAALRRVACRFEDRGRLVDLVDHARGAQAVERWVGDVAPDVVHVHHMTGFGTGALRATARCGVPTVVSLHDHWVLCPRGQSFMHATLGGGRCDVPAPTLCAACCRATWPALEVSTYAAHERTRRALEHLALADQLVAPSPATRAAFVRAGVPPTAITVQPHGVDAARIAQDVRRLGATHVPGKRLGVLGAVQPSKGVLELARAVAGADVPELTLEVHGPLEAYHGDARTIDALRALARDDGRVRLHGPFAPRDLCAVLATLDAVAVPSRWQEAFGLAAREARAASLPVLASAIGGLLMLERDPGVTLVAPDDPGAWVAALRSFDWRPVAPVVAPRGLRDMAEDWLALYASLAGGARRAA
jgi:glycosyltransferase involved in cell wall biosynthesis